MWTSRWRIILLQKITWCNLKCSFVYFWTDFTDFFFKKVGHSHINVFKQFNPSQTPNSTIKSAELCQTSMNFKFWRVSWFSTSSYFYLSYLYEWFIVIEIFNRHVLKTNFYQPTKVALSFRLAPEFLPEIEYPKKSFGMFFVIGTSLQLRLFASADFRDVGCRKWSQRFPYSIPRCCSWWDSNRDVEKQRVCVVFLWLS